MGCMAFRTDQGYGYICGSGVETSDVCRFCGHLAEHLCDYPVGDGKTCDLPLCGECRTKVAVPTDLRTRIDIGEAFDLCPTHVAILGITNCEKGGGGE